MKRIIFLHMALLCLVGCDDDRHLAELKAANAEQRQQVQQLMQVHRDTLDQLSLQLNRQAQAAAEKRTEERTHELSTATMVVLGCALAVTLGLLIRKRAAYANGNGT